MLIFSFIICFVLSIFFTFIMMKLAWKLGIVDQPSLRKIHQSAIPSMGGLAIYISFFVGVLLLKPTEPYHQAIMLGGLIILITGMIDDIFELSPIEKLLGQLIAALTVIFLGDIQMTFINLPFGNQLEFGYLSIPVTIIWIVGVTNAINLIDGLDGLAAGVSSIALISLAGMAMIMGESYVWLMAIILLVSTAGFLIFNFHPAKIFMGDTGALFLGFMISVLSLLGFKNLTFISFIIPILILGVPITDTFFAIIRRIVNNQPLSAPDKSHFHHQLLKLGFSHQQTVLIIYAISALFGLSAFIFSMTTVWGSILIITVLILAIELGAEKIGLISKSYKPLMNIIKGIRTAYMKNR